MMRGHPKKPTTHLLPRYWTHKDFWLPDQLWRNYKGKPSKYRIFWGTPWGDGGMLWTEGRRFIQRQEVDLFYCREKNESGERKTDRQAHHTIKRWRRGENNSSSTLPTAIARPENQIDIIRVLPETWVISALNNWGQEIWKFTTLLGSHLLPCTFSLPWIYGVLELRVLLKWIWENQKCSSFAS